MWRGTLAKQIALTVLLTTSVISLCVAQDDVGWRYTANDALGQAPLQSIRTSEQVPVDVNVNVKFRGTRQHFAQLRYGSPNSIRVVVCVDEIGEGAHDFYVDRDRNRTIDSSDLVVGTGRSRQCELYAEITATNAVGYVPRKVRFRLDSNTSTLGFATIGFVEGTTKLGERMVRVRRVDGDGNGLFADARDRLWIDLDGDEQWDPFSEQFPYVPVLQIAQQRIAIRGDASGNRLQLAAIEGAGQVQLRLATLKPQTKIVSLEVMLAGEDGSALSIRSSEMPVTVPVGRYAVNTLSLALADMDDRRVWRFVFSWNGSPRRRTWFSVSKDETTTIDPVGELSFVIDLPDGTKAAQRGGRLSVRPRLFTQDGLLINSGSCENPFASGTDSSNSARVALRTRDEFVLSTGHSGFA